MKTLIMWKRKRSRTFKAWGLATASSSAVTIFNAWKMAAAGEGTLAIVDAPTAEHARRLLASHLSGQHPDIGRPGVTAQYLDGRAMAIGPHAVLAIAGASEAVRRWDARLARDGKVKVADTRALGARSDGLSFNLLDAFGEGFKRNGG